MPRAKPIEQHIADGTYRPSRHDISGVLTLAPEANLDVVPPMLSGHKWGPYSWHPLAEPLHGTGIVRLTDLPALEMAAMALATWKAAMEQVATDGTTPKGAASTVMHPALRAAHAAEQSFQRWAGRFGLTPSDRAAVGMAMNVTPGADDPWSVLDDDEPADAGGKAGEVD